MPGHRAAQAALTALIITVGLARICEAQAPALDVVLDRLGAYLLDYETKVVELAAEERYKQWIKLHPQYRTRFDFKAAGRERVGGQEAAIVAFQERSTPTTLVSDGFGGELLARGRVWIEPTSGAVLRTELSFNGSAARYLKESAIRVDYQRDPKLQVLLPSEMEETYGLEIEVLHGVATYRNYRRFETAARMITPPN